MANTSGPMSVGAVSGANNNDQSSSNTLDEDDLRKSLRESLQKVARREPLDTTYRHLLMNGIVTPRKPTLPKDKLYKPVTARLRERVEGFGQQHPWDRISQRQEIKDSALSSALNLRECKKHEQEGLLQATLAALPKRSRDEAAREAHLEGMALGLQQKEIKMQKQKVESQHMQQQRLQKQKETERQRLDQQRRNRETAKRRREEQEAKAKQEMERAKKQKVEPATPQRALMKYTQPVFQKLWDMEFGNLGNTNPFRIVIDRHNCAAMGAPDYFDVIKTPMNLAYIQKKVQNAEYESLQAFFSDVDLMLNNALIYNSDPNNDYHLAAKEMSKQFKRMAKAIVQKLKQIQQRNK